MTPDQKNAIRDWRQTAWLVGVIVLATLLRFAGLRWGLPNHLHSYSYHPDEFLTLGAAFGSIYMGRSILPRFYNYPSLYIYLAALAIAVGMGYGIAANAGAVYLCARIVTALMGVGAVVVTYWAGRELFGPTEGLLAAVILAVAPLHVQHSHFATVDVPSTLFIAAALGFAGLILKRGNWRDYITAGAMAGFAAGTKYNAALVVLSVIVAHFLRDKRLRESIIDIKLWAALGSCIAAFVISTPACVLDTGAFINGITYEMRHTSQGHGLVFAGTGNGFIYTFTNSLWYGLGPFMAVLFLIALAWAILKRDKRILMLLAFAVPYYAMISLSQVRFARYTLPLFPVVVLLCAWAMTGLGKALDRKLGPAMKLMWIADYVFVLLLTVLYTAQIVKPFVLPDVRDRAAEWVMDNVPKGSSIAIPDLPWFYSPPLSKDFGFGAIPQREEALNKTPYKLEVMSQENWTDADWAIVSSYETDDAVRLRNNKSLSDSDRKQVDRILQDMTLIREHYRVRRIFPSRLQQRNLPHDMRYTSPSITIYQRVK